MQNNTRKEVLSDKKLYYRTINKTAIFTGLFSALIGALIGWAICMLMPLPEAKKSLSILLGIAIGGGVNFVFGTVGGIIFGSIRGHYKLSIRERNRLGSEFARSKSN